MIQGFFVTEKNSTIVLLLMQKVQQIGNSSATVFMRSVECSSVTVFTNKRETRRDLAHSTHKFMYKNFISCKSCELYALD